MSQYVRHMRRFAAAALSLFITFALLPPRAFAVGDAEEITSYKWRSDGGKSGVYRIGSAEELEQLSALVISQGEGRDTFEGKTILLTGDVDLRGRNWMPIGINGTIYDDTRNVNAYYQAPFSGTFDGQGYTISGLVIDSVYGNEALFGYLQGAVIRNLTVTGTVTTTGSGAAGLAACGSAVFENCVTDVQVHAANYSGGLMGRGSAVITGCKNLGSITAEGEYCGGLVGLAESGSAASRSGNTGTVTGKIAVGGLFGKLDFGVKTGAIKDCYNFGTVRGGASVGGLVGRQIAGIWNCLQVGKVFSDTASAGAVSGEFGENQNCYYLRQCLTAAGAVMEAVSPGCVALTAEQLQSGEAAYLLSRGGEYERTYTWSQGERAPEPTGTPETAPYRLRVICEGVEPAEPEREYYRPGDEVRLVVTPEPGVVCRLVWATDIYGDKIASAGGVSDWSFVMPASDIQVTAAFIDEPDPNAFFDITLDFNDGSGRKSVELRAGGLALALPEPEREGYRFLGWSRELDATELEDPRGLACEALTLYACWLETGLTEVKVSGNFQIGPWEETIISAIGQRIEKSPEIPARPAQPGSRFDFVKWSAGRFGDILWDPVQDPVTEDLRLFAQWEIVDVFARGYTPETAAAITTTDEMIELARRVDMGRTYEGRYFRLGADLTFGADWPGIGKKGTEFCGILDGAGYTITLDGVSEGLFGNIGAAGGVLNLNVAGTMTATRGNTERAAIGLIADSCDGYLKNCRVAAMIYAPEEEQIQDIGGLVGHLGSYRAGGRMDNCEFQEGCALTGSVAGCAGGLAAYCDGTISNSQNNGDILLKAGLSGGICGYMGPGIISGCINGGTVNNPRGGAAGILGGSVNGCEVTIERTVNSGAVTGIDVAAGILAAYSIIKTENYGTHVVIRDSKNTGAVTAADGAAGGILGSPGRSPKASLNVEIIGCTNAGDIFGTRYVGGIAGVLDSYYDLGGMGAAGRELATVTECVNEGNVTASGDYAGGIVGANTMYGSITLSGVESSGDVSGRNYVGGIAGYVDHSHYGNIAQDVKSSGNITASGSYVGGLMGYGAVSGGFWNGSSITVGENSRFVSELVGDVHSIVSNSRYEYSSMPVDETLEEEPELKRNILTVPVMPPEQPALPQTGQTEGAAEHENKGSEEPDTPPTQNPTAAAETRINSDISDVTRDTVQINTIVIATVLAGILLIFLIGILYNYRAYRSKKK